MADPQPETSPAPLDADKVKLALESVSLNAHVEYSSINSPPAVFGAGGPMCDINRY
jgi:hypothetical protein